MAAASPMSSQRQQVTDDLEKVRSFVSGVQEKGEGRLPPERELAHLVGLTRSRLRGALKKLVDEEVIWREVGNGTYFGQRPLIGAGSSRKIDLANLTSPSEVMEARLMLEPELARLSAFRARRENIEELELCVQKMGESNSQSEWAFWDRRFHRAIARAAGNTLLVILTEAIQANMDRETWGELSDRVHEVESTEEWMNDHVAILNAIKTRSPSAASEVMKKHLMHIQQIYFSGA
jgi:DNA-binding FadR family transcriptional regulator